MNLRPYKAILWKECRTLGGLWIAAVLLAVLLGTSVVMSGWRESNLWYQFVNLLAAVPAFYATGCAATMFAGERETRNHLFLSTLPVSSRQLFGAKLVFAIASTIVLAAVVAAGALLFRTKLSNSVVATRLTGEQLLVIWAVWLTFAAVGLSSGFLASLFTKRAITAICCGMLIASTLVHLATWAVTDDLLKGKAERLPWLFPLVFAAASFLLVAGRLAMEWPLERTSRIRIRRRKARVFRERATSRTWPRVKIFGRMLWLAWRQSRVTIVAMLFVSLAVSYWGMVVFAWSRDNIGRMALAFQFAIISALIGSAVFQVEKRFLVDRGASAMLFWISRHLLWIPIVLIAVVPLMNHNWPQLATNRPDFPHPGPQRSLVLDWWLMLMVGAYSIGQLGSLLIRSAPVAMTLGVALVWPMVIWAAMMADVRLSFWTTILPVAVGLLVVSAVAMRWLIDERLSRLRTAAMFGAALIIVAVQVASVRAWRIHSVEEVAVSSVLLKEPTTTAAEIQGAELYRQAYFGLTEFPPDSTRESKGNYLSLTPERENWLAQHTGEIALAIEASGGPAADFAIRPDSDARMLDNDVLIGLLDLSGQSRAAADDLPGALDSYWAMLHFNASANHYRQYNYAVADFRLERGLNHLMRWAALPGQTKVNMQRAAGLLEKLPELYHGASDEVELQYRDMLRMLEKRGQLISCPISLANILPRIMGEPERARRVLNVLASEGLAEANFFERWMREGKSLHATTLSVEPDLNLPRSPLVESTPSIRYVHLRPPFMMIAQRTARIRAVQLVLALQRWKLDHGEFPQTLDPLVPEYLNELPIDPYSGEVIRYFPKGFSFDLPITGDSSSIEARAYWNQPFVWAMGPNVRRPDRSESTDQPYFTLISQRDPESNRRIRVWQGASEYDALRQGMVFPLNPASE